MSNAITHGQAERIEVSLAFQNRQGTLAIQDDGVGIGDGSDLQPGMGLHTMAYRARVIGGTLQLNGRSPRGTVVTCVFPLPPADPTPGRHSPRTAPPEGAGVERRSELRLRKEAIHDRIEQPLAMDDRKHVDVVAVNPVDDSVAIDEMLANRAVS